MSVDELRRDIASAHGLPEEATSFLAGTTVAELEESAVRLAELFKARGAPEPEPAPESSLTAALLPGAKAARQRALVELLHPKQQQQLRDPQTGQFAAKPSGFDGGARTPTLTREPPEREHDRLVTTLSQFARTYGGNPRL
jgi:hypothetical protein